MKVLQSHTLGSDVHLIESAARKMGLGPVRWYGNLVTMDGDPDLVFLAGGADVDPMRYGGVPELCGEREPLIDRWDQRYIPMALENEWPIFGICRGIQTLAVELGGRLIEEIYPDHGKFEVLQGEVDHLVTGRWGAYPVNSIHHQGVDYESISDKVTVTAWALDGTPEAYIYKDFALGVQWHPEWMDDSLYSWQLVEAVITRRVDKIAKFDPYQGLVYEEVV